MGLQSAASSPCPSPPSELMLSCRSLQQPEMLPSRSPQQPEMPSCQSPQQSEMPPCRSPQQPEPGRPERLWVFGYGSLCWRPGFPYEERRIGHVQGYTRRFWQGSVTHRGTPDQPGRVATLVEQRQGTTWGCAFGITDPAALRYLHGREVALGGYQARQVVFAPREAGQPPFVVTVYLATEGNPLWLGEAPLDRLARQVAAAAGRCGPNADYVLQLVLFMKRYIPEERDRHLFDLATLVETAVGPGDVISPSAGGASSPSAGGAISPGDSEAVSSAGGAISASAGGAILPGDSVLSTGAAISLNTSGSSSPAAGTAASPAKTTTGVWRRRCSQETQDDVGPVEPEPEPACRCH